jgi:hypothetical protein
VVARPSPLGGAGGVTAVAGLVGPCRGGRGAAAGVRAERRSKATSSGAATNTEE